MDILLPSPSGVLVVDFDFANGEASTPHIQVGDYPPPVKFNIQVGDYPPPEKLNIQVGDVPPK